MSSDEDSDYMQPPPEDSDDDDEEDDEEEEGARPKRKLSSDESVGGGKKAKTDAPKCAAPPKFVEGRPKDSIEESSMVRTDGHSKSSLLSLSDYKCYEQQSRLVVPFDMPSRSIQHGTKIVFSGRADGVAVFDAGPITQWWVIGFERDDTPSYGFTTAHADYVINASSCDYAAAHGEMMDKLVLAKASVNFLREKPGHKNLLYADLVERAAVVGRSTGRLLNEAKLLRHAKFIVAMVQTTCKDDATSSTGTTKLPTTPEKSEKLKSHAIKELKRLAKIQKYTIPAFPESLLRGGVKVYVCEALTTFSCSEPDCAYTTHHEERLRLHVKRHSVQKGKKPCPGCGNLISDGGAFRKHLKSCPDVSQKCPELRLDQRSAKSKQKAATEQTKTTASATPTKSGSTLKSASASKEEISAKSPAPSSATSAPSGRVRQTRPACTERGLRDEPVQTSLRLQGGARHGRLQPGDGALPVQPNQGDGDSENLIKMLEETREQLEKLRVENAQFRKGEGELKAELRTQREETAAARKERDAAANEVKELRDETSVVAKTNSELVTKVADLSQKLLEKDQVLKDVNRSLHAEVEAHRGTAKKLEEMESDAERKRVLREEFDKMMIRQGQASSASGVTSGRIPEYQRHVFLPSDYKFPKKGDKVVVVIDGRNTGCQYGEDVHRQHNYFVAKGLGLAVDYFVVRGHAHVITFIPESFKRSGRVRDPGGLEMLENLHKDGHLVWTPSRKRGDEERDNYDDDYIVTFAKANKENNVVIVSGDYFADILRRISTDWELRRVVERRRIAPRFPGGMLVFDPFPYPGVSLDQLLTVA